MNGQLKSNTFIQYLTFILIFASVTFSVIPAEFNWNQLDPHGSYVEGSMITQLQFGLIYLCGLGIAITQRHLFFQKLRYVNPFLILFIVYCFITALWSPFPVVTIKRSFLLVGFFIVGLAITPPPNKSQHFFYSLLTTLFIIMLLSLLVVLVIPSIGIDRELDNAWRGILSQKNSLGVISAIAMLLSIRAYFTEFLPKGLAVFAIFFSTFILLMSKSTTAFIVCLFCIFCYLVMRKRVFFGYFDNTKIALCLSVAVLLFVWLFYIVMGHLPTWHELFSPIGFLLDKSSDLTGRTQVWGLVILSIEQHPILGIGYGAFWLGTGSLSQYITDIAFWSPLQSHNAYLDILNELGIVGCVITLAIFIVHIYQLTQLAKFDKEEAAFHGMLFIYVLISNISESEIFRGTQFLNIIFFYSSLAISARLMQYRMK